MNWGKYNENQISLRNSALLARLLDEGVVKPKECLDCIEK